MSKDIRERMKAAPFLGDGGYLIELDRRSYVASGSRREKVGTGEKLNRAGYGAQTESINAADILALADGLEAGSDPQ